MSSETFMSRGITFKITVYPAPSDGKKYPVVLLLHGNFGLGSPFGEQIKSFARDLATEGYMTVVPQYFQDDELHPFDFDPVPKVQILKDAISHITIRLQADLNRLGLIGFSLGATTAMNYISFNPLVKVKVLADFFGFITQEIQNGILSFPPTIIFHNKNDQIVPIQNSKKLDRLLQSTIEHEFVPYDEEWPVGNHAFKPVGYADDSSRSKTVDWFRKYHPPTGI